MAANTSQGLYTALIICLNVISGGGGSNLYPPEMEGTFTPEEINERIYGSKIVVISEQAMLNVIYTIKASLLLMYSRLTLGLNTQRYVKYLAIFVALGWLASEIAFFTACRPFQGYWGMPPPDPQCTTLQHYAIVQGCFNISSDTLMLFIPLPLIFRLNMAWKQKIVLVFIFSLGAFVIIAALLTKIFNLTDLWNPTYMLWYVREASVAVYVSNLPMIWPLLREWFPCLRGLNPSGVIPTTDGQRKSHPIGKGTRQTNDSSRNHSETLSSRRRGDNRSGDEDDDSIDGPYGLDIALKNQSIVQTSSSTERIVDDAPEPVRAKTRAPPGLGGIQVERTVIVEQQISPRNEHHDLEKGLYDWDHAGASEHKTKVIVRH
jgi:hypothetical protein